MQIINKKQNMEPAIQNHDMNDCKGMSWGDNCTKTM